MVMMNLFSVFDPSSSFYFSTNWVSMIFIFFCLPISYYFGGGLINSFFFNILSILKISLMEISFPSGYGAVYFSVSLFFFISMNNLAGLFPFIFTITTHPMITLSMGLVLWLSFFLFGMINNFKSNAAHMVPEGSPFMLSFFMVNIEVVSHLIRPITLSIRLAANMMSGHLIVGLLSSISEISLMWSLMSVGLQLVLMILELCVSVIQGFVFSVLLLLYFLDYS